MAIPEVSNNTTGTLEQKKTNSWTPVGKATDKKRCFNQWGYYSKLPTHTSAYLVTRIWCISQMMIYDRCSLTNARFLRDIWRVTTILNCLKVGKQWNILQAYQNLVPKSETRGFDSWLTSSLRIECNFPLATSDIQMMSETKFYS